MEIFRYIIPAIVTLLAACDESPSYPQRTPPEGFLQNPAHIESGQQLFREHCVECHGTREEGRRRAADFHPPASTLNLERHRSADPAYLFWRISTGKTVEPYRSRGSVMPAWRAHFSDEQIWQIVAYIKNRH